MEPPPFWRNSDSAFSPYKIKKRDHHSQKFFPERSLASRIFHKREILITTEAESYTTPHKIIDVLCMEVYIGPPPFWRKLDPAFSPYKIKKRDHHSQNIFQKGFQTSRIFIKREIIQGPPFPSLPNISLRHSHTNN